MTQKVGLYQYKNSKSGFVPTRSHVGTKTEPEIQKEILKEIQKTTRFPQSAVVRLKWTEKQIKVTRQNVCPHDVHVGKERWYQETLLIDMLKTGSCCARDEVASDKVGEENQMHTVIDQRRRIQHATVKHETTLQ